MDTSAFDSDATLAEFLDEARGNLETVNCRLLDAERGPLGDDGVNELFRGAHSFKGLSGMFNLAEVCETTHALETVFDRIRKHTLEFTREVIDASFAACDLLNGLLDDLAARRGATRPISPVITRLNALVQGTAPAALATAPAAASAPPAAWSGIPERLAAVFAGVPVEDLALAGDGTHRAWLMRLPMRELLERHRDPVQTYQELEKAVEILVLEPVLPTDVSPWMPLDAFDYQVVALVLTDEPLPKALGPLCLPRYDAWKLDPATRRAERVVVDPEPEAAAPDDECLFVKEDMRKHIPTWLSETTEELEAFDRVLLALEKDPADQPGLQEAFRIAHRIKGSAGAMGLDPLARVAHNLEWLLDLLRTNRLGSNGELVEDLFAVKDFLRTCVERVQAEELAVPDHGWIDAIFIARREAAGDSPNTLSIKRGWQPPAQALERAGADLAAGERVWRATVALRDDCTLPDLRCQLILGHIARVARVISSQPTAEELEKGISELRSFHLMLASSAGEVELRDHLQVDEVLSCHLDVLHDAQVETAAFTPSNAPEASADPVLAAATAGLEAPAPAPTPPPAEAAKRRPEAPAGDKGPATTGGALVRIDAARIDQLLNIAGEVVVAKARINTLVEALQRAVNGRTKVDLKPIAAELAEATAALHRCTGTLQTNAMQMRMVPVAPLFQRFQRVIRDLCRDLGKHARLVMAGEGTELDKKLIDELVDPITHLVRNALDHGLEEPAERVAAGKPEEAEVRLEAFQERGQICIRIRDDGRGIDHRRIRAKVVEKGIMTQAQVDALDERSAVELIFLPGFSTAAQVTNVSGRGVGMDIVRARIAELKGTVEIDTTPGAGTAFTIRLPLTLAMIKALMVSIGGERFALPLEAVREIVDVPIERLHRLEGGGRLLPLRKQAVPVIDLDRAIGLRAARPIDGVVRAIITKGGRETVAIPVDSVQREEEIVVKALPEEFSKVRGLAGASIRGDGGIALILDIPTVIGALVARGRGTPEVADARR